jgi:predicted helicase
VKTISTTLDTISAQAVNRIKRNQRFTVIIGNPPYSVSSWNTGEWITNLVEVYKRTVRGEESQIQSLSNDYIKFLRFCEWQIEQAHVGVLGMITGHGYLHGTQPRDLRDHLSDTFERCYCLDLNGSIRRVGTSDDKDEPVFQIMTGVAIIVALRTWMHRGKGATTLASLTGRLVKKFDFLREQTSLRISSNSIFHQPAPPYFRFAPLETTQDIAEEYHKCLDLADIFGTGNRQTDKEVYWATGFASQQDDLAMSFSPAEVGKKMSDLAASTTFEELNQSYRLCTTNQWDYQEAKKFANRRTWRDYIGQVAYRPFDRRWTVMHKNVLTILRKQVMSQLTGNEGNLGLISSRAVNDLTFAHCFVTNGPVDKIFISSKTSTNAYVFPLFFKSDDLYGQQRVPNFSLKFLKSLATSLGLQNTGQHGLPAGLTPEDIFRYIYAILYSLSYRSRYGEFLKVDFPRLQLPSSLELFRALAQLGGELVTLHLVEFALEDEVNVSAEWPRYPRLASFYGSDRNIGKFPSVDRAWKEGRVAINAIPNTVIN